MEASKSLQEIFSDDEESFQLPDDSWRAKEIALIKELATQFQREQGDGFQKAKDALDRTMGKAYDAHEDPKGTRKANLLPFGDFNPWVRQYVLSGYTKDERAEWAARTYGELIDLAEILKQGDGTTSRPATFEDYERVFGQHMILTNNPDIEDLLEQARNPGYSFDKGTTTRPTAHP